MFCLITSSKLSCKFEFPMKVEVMGSNSGYPFKSFLLYVWLFFCLSVFECNQYRSRLLQEFLKNTDGILIEETRWLCIYIFRKSLRIDFVSLYLGMFQLFCQNFESGAEGSGILQEFFRPEFHSQKQGSLERFNLFSQNFESGADGSGILQKMFQPVFRSQKQPSLVCFIFFVGIFTVHKGGIYKFFVWWIHNKDHLITKGNFCVFNCYINSTTKFWFLP